MAVLVRCYSSLSLDFFRIITAYCSSVGFYSVGESARVHVGLSYSVGVSDVAGVCACCKLGSKTGRSAVVIGKGQSGHLHVSGIDNLYGVGHGVTNCHAAGLVGALGDRKLGSSVLSCYGSLGLDFCRILTAYCSSISFYGIGEGTRVYVCLSYSVGVGDVAGIRACFELGSKTGRSAVVIGKGQSGHLYVSGVGDLNGVSNGVTRLNAAGLVCSLGDRKLGSSISSGDDSIITSCHCRSSGIGSCGSSGIVDLAFIYVGLSYRVGVFYSL